MTSTHLLIMAKAPISGQVKTRLATDIGDSAALSLYKAFLGDVFSGAEKTGFSTTVFITPPAAINQTEGFVPDGISILPQATGDLGKKMYEALKTSFGRGAEKALLIGTDTPGTPPGMFKKAEAALDTSGMVIAPSNDGGYFLIGFSKKGFTPKVFQKIQWSTPDVLSETLKISRRIGLTYEVLETLVDIDNMEDLHLWRSGPQPEHAPHTRDMITRLCLL